MNHYFISDKSLKSEVKELKVVLINKDFSFLTDNGVFSKTAVDYGSKALISAFTTNGKRILDVGCGYGPIGIVLGKLNPKHRIDMVDINERAIDLAKKNIVRNAVNNVTAKISDLYQFVDGKYFSIVSNPPIRAGKHIVHAIITDAKNFLENEGEFWLVIQKKQGSSSAKQKMLEVYGNVEVVLKDKGYNVLKSVKK